MKRGTIVTMLLITTMLTVMGCAKNEAVKKDDGTITTVTQKDAKKIVPTETKQSGSEIIAADAQQGATAGSSDRGTAFQSGIDAVYFGFDSNVLTDESRKTLQADFKRLENKPSLQIEGNCDERGSSEYNLALGEKRAKAAQNYLVTLGYPAEKISIISYGKEKPADQGHDETAWAKNRRDELKIVK